MQNPYISKTWVDRISEFPTRRRITNTQDPTDVKQIYVERDEGTVTETGDPFAAQEWNNWESRINAAFAAIIAGFAETLTGTTAPTSAQGKNGDTYVQTETDQVSGDTTVAAYFVKISGEWLEIQTGGGGTLTPSEGRLF